MLSPYKGNFRITSIQAMRWGKPHRGLDMVGVDKSIYAVSDGIVVKSEIITDRNNESWAFGNRVWIRDKQGKIVCYNHLSARKVFTGQVVKAGELIGIEGGTGDCVPAGASHLHIELRSNLGAPFTELKIYEYLDMPNQVKAYTAPVVPVSVESLDDILKDIARLAKFDTPVPAIAAMKKLNYTYAKDLWIKIRDALK